MTERAHAELQSERAGEGLQVEATVAEVVVMEDRAQVVRRVELELQPGLRTLRVSPVTPLVADRTVSCRVEPVEGEGGAALADLQVGRRYLLRRRRPEQEQALGEAIEALYDEYHDVLDEELSLLHERGLSKRTAEVLGRQVQDRLAVGPVEPSWPEELQGVFERRAALEQRLLALQTAQEERQARYDHLQQERRLALQPEADYRAELVTQLQVSRAGRYRVRWEYQVPCALWRPSYRGELLPAGEGEDGGSTVRWDSQGTVWQATGEAWEGVQLSFSTARPTLGAELPLLEDDVLRTRDKSSYERQVIEVESRDQEIARTSDLPQEQRTDTPPGLDDGGEARTYTVPEPVTVPSDGRPHTVRFESWTAPAETELLCLPERALYVFLRSIQRNPSALPLLAGPVSLVRGGQYVGRAEIGYVAPGDRFPLAWGSEDGVVVLRNVTREREQTTVRKTQLNTFKVEVYLANHTGQAQQLTLVERMPISELEKVKVELLEKSTTAGHSIDEQGLLRWEVALAAGQERRLGLTYRVSLPSNVRWNA